MAFNDFKHEAPENFEQKTICCFVVDVSGSMEGEPIKQLNNGLQRFHQNILNDSTTANRLEVAVVKFNDEVDTVVPPALASNFTMPTLTAKNTTKMVDGVREAISLVEERKNWYKDTGQPYLRPWIILISDGAPDPDQDVDALEKEIETATKNKKFVFLPLGVENADMKLLNQIAGYIKKDGNWKKMQAMKLKGLEFNKFFDWVSASMSIIANSNDGDNVSLANPNDWLDNFEI